MLSSRFFSFFFILLFSQEIQALCCKPSVELKTGYFFFADEKMRSVYNDGGLDLQLSSSFPIWKWLQIYTSIEYLQKQGHALSTHQKTNIWQVPVTVGLKACMKMTPTTSYYLTLAPRYFYMHVQNSSCFVDKNLHKNGVGAFVGTGFTITACTHFLIEIFGEYSYQKAHFHSAKTNVYSRNIQVGGLVFGAGLGYAF